MAAITRGGPVIGYAALCSGVEVFTASEVTASTIALTSVIDRVSETLSL